MSRRKDPLGRGRPSIGQPEMVWGRVATGVRDQVDELSEQLGIPRSRVVASLLDVGLANLDQAKFPTPKAKRDQQELPLKTA